MVNYFITIIAKFSSIYDAIVVQFYNLLILLRRVYIIGGIGNSEGTDVIKEELSVFELVNVH